MVGIYGAIIGAETGGGPDASQARLTIRFNRSLTCGIYLAGGA